MNTNNEEFGNGFVSAQLAIASHILSNLRHQSALNVKDQQRIIDATALVNLVKINHE